MRNAIGLAALWATATLVLSACSDDALDVEPFSIELEWSPCPLITEGSDLRAECADVEVPLFWSEPEGERIQVFLKRYRGAVGGGQVWVLPGGPGQTGSDVEPLVEQMITLDGQKSYYLIDHRGVGRSTRLRCPSSEGLDSANGVGLGEGEIQACLDEIRLDWSDAELAGFSSTEAARDVGQLVEHLREGDETVSLWGGSYGTLWLERYLNLYPDQPDSVVYSAIATDVDLLSVDRYVDEVTRRWADACDENAGCGPRFQATFASSAREIVESTFSGAGKTLCPEIEALEIDIPSLKPFFGQIFADLQGRSLFAPMVYRMARCEANDVAAIGQLVQAFTPPDGTPPEPGFGIRNWGFVLGENIAVSELTSERSAEEVQSDYDNAVAVQGNSLRLSEARALWPRYEAPPFENSNYAGPLLLLHGEFDFLPEDVYRRTVDHYLAVNPNASFVLLPGAPHSLESPTRLGGQCGISLIVSRLLDPAATIANCASEVESLSFAPAAGLSMSLFGVEDPFDG